MDRSYHKSLVMYSDGHFTWMNIAEGLVQITLPKNTSVGRVGDVRDPMTPFETICFRKVIMRKHFQRYGRFCRFEVDVFMQEGSNGCAFMKARKLVEEAFKEYFS